jgi:carbamate kinase
VELDMIRLLAASGMIVVCADGGGIPWCAMTPPAASWRRLAG